MNTTPTATSAVNTPPRGRSSHGDAFRFAILLFILTLLVGTLTTAFFYTNARAVVMKEVRDMLIHTAKGLASLVDGDLHRTFTDPSQESSHAYERAIAPLRQFRQSRDDLKFIYTAILRDGKIYFVLDSTPAGDADADGIEDHAFIMEEYAEPDRMMIEALETGIPLASEELYTDRWGTFLSGYAPIYDSAGVMVGILGVDMNAGRLQNNLSSIARTALVNLVVTFVLSLLVAVGTFVVRTSVQRTEELGRITLEEIQTSHNRFQSLIETAVNIIVGLTPEGEIFEWNREAEKVYRRHRDDMLGLDFFELCIAEEERPAIEREMRDVLKGGTAYILELNTVPIGGRRHTILWNMTRLVNSAGQSEGVILIGTDITERKAAEVKLRASEEKFRVMNEASPLGIFLTDPDGYCTYINSNYLQITGIPAEQAVGSSWTDSLHPEDRERAIQNWTACSRAGTVYDDNHRIIKKSGDVVHIHAKAAPIFQDARVSGYIGTIEDITRQKDAEQLLIQSRDDAQSGLRTKSEFLAMISHEIRTPLNAIVGMGQLLNETSLDAEQRQFVEALRKSGDSLLNLINDVLDFSKIESGRMQIEAIPFALQALINDAVALFREPVRQRGVRVECRIEPYVPARVIGDPGRLRQILLNLVSNACKFTHAGSVEVTANVEESEDDLILLKIEVADTGIGIAPVSLATLFDAFVQADASTTRKYGGTGLGLAIAKRLAELMGGELGVRSEPGQGSVFWFTVRLGLPPDEEITERPPRAASQVPSGEEAVRPLRLLLAEDNAVNQMVVIKTLEKLSHSVEIANNGREAVEKWKSAPYDAIIMDCQMPEMDGYEASREIRRLEKERQTETGSPLQPVYILALTAHAMEGDREKCLKAGMNDYLSKPLRKDEIMRALAKVRRRS